ncbi:MAG TPA: SRPBCC family protein [Acidobacteriaceae bacterium]|jgi:ligand-binding SRPBCC domain-containing protein|nr:SRPBCC family protein [Acidobacteriaceae bacterium]
MSFRYQTEQWVPYPVDTVFAFFANPENLPALMPMWQKARIEHTSIVPPERSASKREMAGAGSRITLSFRPFPGAPFRVRWEAEITEFVLNSHFTDCQIKGPFAFWNHTHRIRSVDRAGINITVIIDQIEYAPPMGRFGRLANRLFLRKQLESTFAFRQSQTGRLLAEYAKLMQEPPLKESKLA